MGKLRILSGKEVCQILATYGFKQIRQKGSHIIMQKIIENGTITVPIPNHDTIRMGTLQSIIRQSQIPRKEFES
ncbi:type II toxin-antitoxin system HicA family toxin [Cyanobacterium aponinum]|uniref:YcfA family protein n=1 Tax=Cyanobacterium aponinum (strain PCC 10605) TaxID=755178 RepID=K9Z7S0_CYAAP|nr:type II toxin-antitoxin system HicA family toxin [Cyanobacterium aponinum]AFZ54448.1 YcfA family protein [Cyanobacterium aponinum PCC 10605]